MFSCGMKQIMPRILALLCSMALPLAATAQAAAIWAGRDEGQVRLIAGDSKAETGDRLVGVEMQLQAGWHTYWRVPGDSGIAPRFDWSASDNVAAIDMKWPTPERFEAPDDNTYGYAHHVIWPLRVTPLDPAKPVELRLTMFYGICSDICVPAEAALVLVLSPGGKADPAAEELLAGALSRLPKELTPHDAGNGLHVWWAVGDPSLLMIEKGGHEAGTMQLTLQTPDQVQAGYVDGSEEEGRHVFIVPLEAVTKDAFDGAPIAMTFTTASKSEDVSITLP